MVPWHIQFLLQSVWELGFDKKRRESERNQNYSYVCKFLQTEKNGKGQNWTDYVAAVDSKVFCPFMARFGQEAGKALYNF